jgi:hypothetical protein
MDDDPILLDPDEVATADTDDDGAPDDRKSEPSP